MKCSFSSEPHTTFDHGADTLKTVQVWSLQSHCSWWVKVSQAVRGRVRPVWHFGKEMHTLDPYRFNNIHANKHVDDQRLHTCSVRLKVNVSSASGMSSSFTAMKMVLLDSVDSRKAAAVTASKSPVSTPSSWMTQESTELYNSSQLKKYFLFFLDHFWQLDAVYLLFLHWCYYAGS